ncbi:MAG: TRAP transporter small permease subunit [Rhodopseudomonas sp.]|nr:TRAP transporter small permease subunit [Rhodopseudomonas sp.]
MNLIRKSLNLSEHILGALSVAAFAVMVVLAAMAVFFRFVVNSSLAFPEEVVRYLFVWSVFLGAAVALRHNMHAAVEMFVDWLPLRLKRPVLALANGLCIVFFAILIVYGVRIVTLVYPQQSPALEISMSYVYAAVPVGAFFMLIYSLEALLPDAEARLTAASGTIEPSQADG